MPRSLVVGADLGRRRRSRARALGAAGARFGVVRTTLARLAARLAAPGLATRRPRPGDRAVAASRSRRAPCTALAAAKPSTYFAPVADRPGFPRALARTLGRAAHERRRRPTALAAAAARSARTWRALAEAVARELAAAASPIAPSSSRAAVARRRAARRHPVGLPLLLLDLPVAQRARRRRSSRRSRARAPRVLATAPAGDERSDRTPRARARRASAERARPRAATARSPPSSRTSSRTTRAARSAARRRACVLSAGRARPRVRRDRARHPGGGARGACPSTAWRCCCARRPSTARTSRRRSRAPRSRLLRARHDAGPHPAGRALLALLACAAEGLSARRFAEYLSLAQVPDPGRAAGPGRALGRRPRTTSLPAAGGPPPVRRPRTTSAPDPDAAAVVAGTLRAPWRWERLLVDAAVIGGRERWARRLDGLARGAARAAATRSATRTRRARARLERDAARDLGAPARLRAAADRPPRGAAARARPGASGSTACARSPPPRCASPSRVLAVLAELAPMAPVGPRRPRRGAARARRRACASSTVPPPRRRYGAVFVAPTEAARGLAFDVVFVPGPRREALPAEDRRGSAPARRRARGGSARRPRRRRRTAVARERLALRLAVGAARRARRALVPAPRRRAGAPARAVVLRARGAARRRRAAARASTSCAARAQRAAARGSAGPRRRSRHDAIDEAEYDLALLDAAARRRSRDDDRARRATCSPPTRTSRARCAPARRRWLATLDAGRRPRRSRRRWRARRSRAHQLDRALVLADRAPALRRVPVPLLPAGDPPARAARGARTRSRSIDPLTRGALVPRRAVRRADARCATQGLLPVAAGDARRARRVLDAVLDAVAARVRGRRSRPRSARLGRRHRRASAPTCASGCAARPRRDDGWVPAPLRAVVRPRRTATAARGPGERRRAGALLDGGAPAARLDRPRRAARDGALRATDHKTGKVARGRRRGRRRRRDPAAGALRARAASGCSHGAGRVAGRLYYCTADGGFTERVVPLDDRAARAAAPVVARSSASALARGLPARGARAGRLPLVRLPRRCAARTRSCASTRKPAGRASPRLTRLREPAVTAVRSPTQAARDAHPQRPRRDARRRGRRRHRQDDRARRAASSPRSRRARARSTASSR